MYFDIILVLNGYLPHRTTKNKMPNIVGNQNGI